MATDEGELLAWCVVANVAEVTRHGHGGADEQRGLKHFTAGAKVWVLPPQWGDGGESPFVVGHHRGGAHRGYVRMVVERRHLTNFRVRGIYSPVVIDAATAPWDKHPNGPSLWESRDQAEDVTRAWSLPGNPLRHTVS